jgi:large subunit ribosomal protein L13
MLWELRADKPDEIIRRAVMGMLPKNHLRAKLIARLHVRPESTHEFADKLT